MVRHAVNGQRMSKPFHLETLYGECRRASTFRALSTSWLRLRVLGLAILLGLTRETCSWRACVALLGMLLSLQAQVLGARARFRV